ncbi:hypothetical protein PsorP6_017616 [Peronosclerospora sorghi]|uniref:Uncharacterized protein n=1 Tax=Peronosclerospora sorghi TaxID=230839 RepID=A0ACC0WN64_9STRA|nr:hypothetical protein PsorP6_017616 [Peronosclerospora sorghi]
MLEFPLHDGFFPQITLTREEIKYYKRLGKTRVAQLSRIIEDADCAYKWSPANAPRRRPRSRLPRLSFKGDGAVSCQRATFLDFQPVRKTAHASTLLKASVHLRDTSVDEILHAIGKSTTKEFRQMMRYMHGDRFVDGRTLLTFPRTSIPSRTHHPSYLYRAIKWQALKTPRSRPGERPKCLDFCYLEYTGTQTPRPGSHVVGFCIQESIARDRDVPSFETYGLARGYLSKMGYIVSQTHHAQTFQVTCVCQVEGDVPPLVRPALESVLQATVQALPRLEGLVLRQRVSRLRLLEHWQWVPNTERKACAVCLRGFYFRRKHHCRTCGEVVCSSCATLRELEEPLLEHTHIRVCSVCLTREGPSFVSPRAAPPLSPSEATTTTSRPALASPDDHDDAAYDDMVFQRRPSDGACVADGASKLEALSNVVSHIRQVRDTIEMTLSEAEHAARPDESTRDVTSLRHAFDTCVSQCDAAIAHTTQRAPRAADGSRAAPGTLTSAHFDAVARITLAAARATNEAGRAVLTLGEPPREEEDALVSDSHEQEHHDTDDGPFSTSNYEKIMASYVPETEDSDDEEDIDDDAQSSSYHPFADSMRRATEIHALEQKIHALQASLEEAQRTLSVIESDDGGLAGRTHRRQRMELFAHGALDTMVHVLDQEDARSAASTTRHSCPSTTHELVSELRGVMESTERGVRSTSGSPTFVHHGVPLDLSLSSSSSSSSSSSEASSCTPRSSLRPPTFFVEEDLAAVWKKRHDAMASPRTGADEMALCTVVPSLVRRRSASVPVPPSRQGGGVSSDEWVLTGSDDTPDRVSSLVHRETTLSAIRACLATCRVDWPSPTTRSHQLRPLLHVLRAIQREGVRSRFRTLPTHELGDVHLCPSRRPLLQLAGYVACPPHGLTMRRVDPHVVALMVHELEREVRRARV